MINRVATATATAKLLNNTNPLWERACPRWQHFGHTDRTRCLHRGQARLPQGNMSVENPAFKQAGRSAASTAFDLDLPAPSGGREEVLRSGPPGMEPGEPRWAMDGPWRRAHGAGPERGNLSAAKAVRRGEDLLVPFGSFQKGLAVRAKPIFKLNANTGYVLTIPVKRAASASPTHPADHTRRAARASRQWPHV